MVNNKELELIINEKELENLGFKKEKREMRIENLEVGKVIKNYKELCGLLGIKVTSGKSKKLQLEDLERYCVYHKEGNKFVVDEIYENPLPKLDGRINGNNNVYVEEIGIYLLNIFLIIREQIIKFYYLFQKLLMY